METPLQVTFIILTPVLMLGIVISFLLLTTGDLQDQCSKLGAKCKKRIAQLRSSKGKEEVADEGLYD